MRNCTPWRRHPLYTVEFLCVRRGRFSQDSCAFCTRAAAKSQNGPLFLWSKDSCTRAERVGAGAASLERWPFAPRSDRCVLIGRTRKTGKFLRGISLKSKKSKKKKQNLKMQILKNGKKRRFKIAIREAHPLFESRASPLISLNRAISLFKLSHFPSLNRVSLL